MEQTPLNPNKQSENKGSINIPSVPPIPPIPSVPPVSSGSPVSPVAPPVQSPLQTSMRSELENRRIELENTPAPEVLPRPAANANTQSSGQQFKLASTEVQGPKPPLVAQGGSKFAMIAIALVLIAILGIGGFYLYKKGNAPQPESSSTPTPVASVPVVDKNLDSDKDGLPDTVEKVLGTDINKADTDGDGFTDLQEVKSGYSPLIVGSVGKYSPEEWDLVKGKIKAENNEFYEKEFGVVLPAMLKAKAKATAAQVDAYAKNMMTAYEMANSDNAILIEGADTVAAGACPAVDSDTIASANTVYYKIPCLPAGYAITVTDRINTSKYNFTVTGFSDGGKLVCGNAACSCSIETGCKE